MHFRHRLLNQLLSLGPGLAFVKATGHFFFVLWERDGHFESQFGNLFETEGFVSANGVEGRWQFDGPVRYDAAWMRWRI